MIPGPAIAAMVREMNEMRASMTDSLRQFVMAHKVYHIGKWLSEKSEGIGNVDKREEVDDLGLADVVSSEVKDPAIVKSMPRDLLGQQAIHRPVLDIDFKAWLIPSTTVNHYHLYLDKPMTWSNYRKLLQVLSEVGIIEHGYYAGSVVRQASFVRLPWVKKGLIKPDNT